MEKAELVPYLFFKGNCREAMEFYKSVFGGELFMQAFSEVPEMQVEDSKKDWLLHARLEGYVTLMASDSNQASPEAKKIELSISGEDEERLRKVFDDLSSGGNVRSPLKKEYWGAIFGSLTDKYGIDWMVNISTPDSGQAPA